MSVNVARQKRTSLYLSVAGLMLVVAALSAISARDPDGITVRTGMILLTVGAAMWLPWQALIPVTLAVWLGPNTARSAIDGYELFNFNMILELPGLLGLGAMAATARLSLADLEQENLLLGTKLDTAGTDPVTGVYEESQLRKAIEIELSRSRRFGRTFALVLVGIDEMRQRFDYRNEVVWQESFAATADLLRGTRSNVDRVYRYGTSGFALILPESEPKDVNGLVKRLRRVARKSKPSEGEPGGPLPAHYGATFFPTCATAVDDLIRRAEIALRISDNNASRVQLDGAEAPEMPPVETLRQAFPAEQPPVPAMTAEEAAPQPQPETGAAQPALHVITAEAEAAEIAPTLAIEPPDAPVTAGPLLAVEDRSPEQESASSAAEPVLATVEPAIETPEPLLAAVDPESEALQPDLAAEATPAEIVDLPNYSNDDDAIEVIEEPPLAVFAYRAPEPAVDVYNSSWQAEAPLSVIRRPQPKPRLVALDGGVTQKPPIEETVLSDALQQLDGTLALIRSLKQRSA